MELSEEPAQAPAAHIHNKRDVLTDLSPRNILWLLRLPLLLDVESAGNYTLPRHAEDHQRRLIFRCRRRKDVGADGPLFQLSGPHFVA